MVRDVRYYLYKGGCFILLHGPDYLHIFFTSVEAYNNAKSWGKNQRKQDSGTHYTRWFLCKKAASNVWNIQLFVYGDAIVIAFA